MLDVKFTDFDSQELNWLYLTLEEKMKDIQSKLDQVEKLFEPSETKFVLHSALSGQMDKCTQFLTKVGEAQKFVLAREIMTTQN